MRLFRRHKISKDDQKLVSLLNHHGIDHVLDVGANKGQYASSLRRAGYHGAMTSFEPLAVNIATLEIMAGKDPLWDINPRCAVGDNIKDIAINVSEANDMSSVLDIADEMTAALPKSRYVTSETVEMITIDSVIEDVCQDHQAVFLKVDTQGFEDAVVQGARHSLESGKIRGVQLELSMLPLYKGEKTYDVLCHTMAEMGFETHLVISGYYSKKIMRQFQADFVFFRS